MLPLQAVVGDAIFDTELNRQFLGLINKNCSKRLFSCYQYVVRSYGGWMPRGAISVNLWIIWVYCTLDTFLPMSLIQVCHIMGYEEKVFILLLGNPHWKTRAIIVLAFLFYFF